MANEATQFDGITFTCMSDEFLISSFDVLCGRTSVSNPNSEDWLDEWSACKAEILKRMKATVSEY